MSNHEEENNTAGAQSRAAEMFEVGVPRAVLWLTGRDLLKYEPEFPKEMGWRIVGPPKPNWQMTLSADATLVFRLPSAPNALHRLMQRFVLGIRWCMLPNTSNSKISGLQDTIETP